MPIKLEGSCHCGAVRFTVQSSTPIPYQLCVCSICRKVGGVGGSINLGAHSDTLEVKGREHIGVYKAVFNRDTADEYIASSERNFCTKCSTMLWLYDETWLVITCGPSQPFDVALRPELLHPFASAIDSPELEPPGEMVVAMTDSKPAYVRLPEGKKSVHEIYGEDSIEGWHKKHGKFIE
ncbi:hypothetical protein BV22DRAFT_1195386 [Leucogyrophana mollusca]|uniref:Uncharacterized protein n=1 Tax=Leucogyrophana mollusca TaxID=85980 RepID=A0ACB8BHT5_9AGAM|nr:hypothetical protein BV22DRAFT_1195386 [Leucogyrophana mollusca]